MDHHRRFKRSRQWSKNHWFGRCCFASLWNVSGFVFDCQVGKTSKVRRREQSRCWEVRNLFTKNQQHSENEFLFAQPRRNLDFIKISSLATEMSTRSLKQRNISFNSKDPNASLRWRISKNIFFFNEYSIRCCQRCLRLQRILIVEQFHRIFVHKDA